MVHTRYKKCFIYPARSKYGTSEPGRITNYCTYMEVLAIIALGFTISTGSFIDIPYNTRKKKTETQRCVFIGGGGAKRCMIFMIYMICMICIFCIQSC